MSDPSYNYLTTDLVTNKVLGELWPSVGITFDRQFNQAGNFTCNLALDDSVMANEAIVANTIPARTAMWVYRESKIVWGGILWTRAYDSNTQQLALTAQTFDTYAIKAYPRRWLSTGSHKYGWGQCHIIQDLWTRLQSVSHGNIGVHPQAESLFPNNDVVRHITVSGGDFTNTVDDIINSLTALSDGPDYTIEFWENGFGMPEKRLRVGNNIGSYVSTINLGGSSGRPALVSDYPEGSVLSYTYTETGTDGYNRIYVIGGATKATKKTKSHVVTTQDSNAYSLDHGYPLIESSFDQGKSTDKDYLASRARAKILHNHLPRVTHATDLIGSELPEFSTYNLGDWWEVNIQDARFPSGVNIQKRVIGWSVTPPDNQGGPETVSVIYDEPQA